MQREAGLQFAGEPCPASGLARVTHASSIPAAGVSFGQRKSGHGSAAGCGGAGAGGRGGAGGGGCSGGLQWGVEHTCEEMRTRARDRVDGGSMVTWMCGLSWLDRRCGEVLWTWREPSESKTPTIYIRSFDPISRSADLFVNDHNLAGILCEIWPNIDD